MKQIQEDKFKIFDEVLVQLKEHNKIIGKPFYRFFKEIKYLKKYKSHTVDKSFLKHMEEIKKEDVIIFMTDDKKIDEQPIPEKKVIFPFNKVFLSYPIIEMVMIDGNPILQFTDGFFIDSIKDDLGKVTGILLVSIWLDYGRNLNNLQEEGVTPRIIMLPYNQLNEELNFQSKYVDFDEGENRVRGYSKEEEEMSRRIINVIKKICYLVQKKSYNGYYKWTPAGIVQKEIVYSHDVKSHKRHFWEDSGKFIIPKLSKEEILSRGYEIDEMVFRGYELRRDVPFKLIESFKVGGEKAKKESNRIISILKKRIFKNEEKLGFLLSEVYPSEFIKKNDRRMIAPLELDYYIHNLKLAFEYDGEQHFDKQICEEVFNSDFEQQKARDIKKNAICRHKKINLIRIRYDEPLNKTYLKKKIKESGGYVPNA